MKHSLTTLALAAAALVGACSSTPAPPPPALVEARSVVQSAELDPGVLSNAPLELKRATDSLNRANTLFAKGQSLNEVESAAYVADRQGRAALAVAQAKRSEEAIRGAQVDRERARADGKSIEAAQAKSAAANAQAQAGIASERAMDAEQRANAAQGQAVAAQANAADVQQLNAQLQQRLNELAAQQTERGLLVTLGDVLFEFNRAEIKPTAQSSLRKLADFLQQYPNRRVLIEGYTDNIGSPAYNATLSQRRAEAVATALMALGVTPQRLSSVGYGKDYPVADNSTDTNRALNRRVEVYISDNDKPVRPRG